MSARSLKFNQEKFRELITIAIVKHDLPFQFVEYEAVRDVFSYLCMDVKSFSRNTTRADVMKIYKREKNRISNLMQLCPGRICLTSDLWTSIVTDGYLCLTAHFIDKDWILQKRVINFCCMPPPHNGISLAEKIHNLLCQWRIETNIFSITLDNASANDVAAELLKTQLSLKDALLCDGSFFHIRCCAHILNLIEQEGLKEIDGSVDKIRECVKYVKGSQSRKKKFMECVAQVSLDSSKALRQDVPTRWNLTFLMLGSTLYYCRAFCHLQLSDSNFKHCPSQEEWGKVEKIHKFLRLFYDITCLFSGMKYPTANLYFPLVFKLQLSLTHEKQSYDGFLRRMATQMFGKFEKYWSEFNLILAIAVIFDPRYKIQFIEFSFNKLYGDGSNQLTHVRNKLFSLFDEYMRKSSKGSSSSSFTSQDGAYSHGSDHEKDDIDFIKEFETFESQEFMSSAQKTQLELYLLEPKIKSDGTFDVLAYWKAHQYRYPVLAQMARDILTIPISTVAFEAAFSVGGRVLDQYRSSLKPDIVEALVCTRDWLYGEGASQVNSNDLTEDIMNLNINKDEDGSAECSNEVNLET
ncbi:hypothetical protein F0562_027758 [Nyssa sinensis]|uniref:HAT C-terminal dimerisation domain-containing protein n=1 Tax=Nyssa sinensis TaxID=561372 RepID=A0A5J5B6I0_9ASTE|nr:hypothetical protein F0562_027758 [Nyssa sinensis]